MPKFDAAVDKRLKAKDFAEPNFKHLPAIDLFAVVILTLIIAITLAHVIASTTGAI